MPPSPTDLAPFQKTLAIIDSHVALIPEQVYRQQQQQEPTDYEGDDCDERLKAKCFKRKAIQQVPGFKLKRCKDSDDGTFDAAHVPMDSDTDSQMQDPEPEPEQEEEEYVIVPSVPLDQLKATVRSKIQTLMDERGAEKMDRAAVVAKRAAREMKQRVGRGRKGKVGVSEPTMPEAKANPDGRDDVPANPPDATTTTPMDVEYSRTTPITTQKIRLKQLPPPTTPTAAWTTALHRTHGHKVLDDPARLKKHQKRLAAKKAKSKRLWEARVEKVRRDGEVRQRRRELNLEKRGGEGGGKGGRKGGEECGGRVRATCQGC